MTWWSKWTSSIEGTFCRGVCSPAWSSAARGSGQLSVLPSLVSVFHCPPQAFRCLPPAEIFFLQSNRKVVEWMVRLTAGQIWRMQQTGIGRGPAVVVMTVVLKDSALHLGPITCTCPLMYLHAASFPTSSVYVCTLSGWYVGPLRFFPSSV